MRTYTEVSQRYHIRAYEGSIYFTAERAVGNGLAIDLPDDDKDLIQFVIEGLTHKKRLETTDRDLFVFLYALSQLKKKFDFDHDDAAEAFVLALNKQGEALQGDALFRYTIGILKKTAAKEKK